MQQRPEPKQTPTPETPGSKSGVQAECTYKHTHPNTPARIGGVKAKLRTQTHTPRTPNRMGRVQAERAHKHKYPNSPGQEWRGAAETQTQAHTPTPHSRARIGRVQAEGAQKHTQPNTPARIGGAQANPKPKDTHPHRTPEPGLAGYRRSVPTDTPQHPSQDWQGESQTRNPDAHTTNPKQDGRGTGGARTQTHTLEDPMARNGGAQQKHEPKHTHPHRTAGPGLVGYRRSERTNTHTPTPQPGLPGRSVVPTQKTHPHRTAGARIGGIQAEPAH